jgi:predicted transcriptional regulator
MIEQLLIRDLVEVKEKLSKDLEELESLIETLEIISNHELMESIKRGLEDIKKGEVTDFDELKKLEDDYLMKEYGLE